MGSHRIRIARMLMVMLLFCVAWALIAVPSVALAAPDEIRGCDCIFAEQEPSEDGAMDILTVSGDDGETIYLEISQADGRVVASHLRYTLHDDEGTADENGKVIGVVSIAPAMGVSLDGATVKVYEDRAQSQLSWEGTITTVYAKFSYRGETTETPLALRTIGNGEERAFVPPSTLRHGVIYALASDIPTTEGGRVFYNYEVSDVTPATVEGHISYYDAENPSEPIKVEAVSDIRRDTSREVGIPDVISVNDHAYRTIQLSDRVKLSYPGVTEYSVQCIRLESSTWASPGSFYKAKIRYVDDQGRSLGVTDSVIVDRRYLYTPPSRLHVRGDDGKFATYSLSSGNDLSDGGAIVLEPGQAEGSQEINIVYEKIPDNAERAWTVVLVNGSVAPNDPLREIKRITYRGKPGQSVTHNTEGTINANGVSLVPASFSESTYRHTFDAAESQIEQIIYYVPDGWVAPDAYEVKVNYVNIATNDIISSESYTATPTMRQDLEIATPQTFNKGDMRYIRLNGQGLAIRHSFYSPVRTYNVYYRESGDDLHTKTVIRSVRVEYLDPETGDTVYRPTTFVSSGRTGGDGASPDRQASPAGFPTTAPEAPTANSETPGGARVPSQTAIDMPRPENADTETGIGTDEGVVSIIDDDTPLGLITDEGADLATVRIEDNETPLTSGPAQKSPSAHPAPIGVVVGAGAGAIAIAGGLALFFLVRRRRRKGDMNPKDGKRHSNGGR